MIKLLPYILFEKKRIYILASETASPGNQHCANCIGALSYPIFVELSPRMRIGQQLARASVETDIGLETAQPRRAGCDV